MRFAPSEENVAFADSLDDLLGKSDTPAAARAWARGDHGAGLAIWARLAELGVNGLAIGEEYDGVGGDAGDLAVAFTALGYHAVPGPAVESVAVLPALLGGTDAGTTWLPRLAGGSLGTVAAPPRTPYLLDADVAELRVLVGADGAASLAEPTGEPLRSVDPTRRLFTAASGATLPGVSADAADRAARLGAFAVAAQLLGLGRRLLDMSVQYAKERSQYGHLIGEYQSIKHLLADVATRLELATPLLQGAAVSLTGGDAGGVDLDPARDVAAARVAAGDAAYLAARTALQVHGAIGYTAEHDLGIWLTKVRALQSAWGTPAEHRATVLGAVRRHHGLAGVAR